MTTDHPTEDFSGLDTDERRLLQSLPREVHPSPDIEDKTIQALRQRHLLVPPRTRWIRLTTQVAAALALAFTCFLAGRATAPQPETPVLPRIDPAQQSGERYLFMLYQTDSYTPPTAAEYQSDYSEWWSRYVQEPSGILWADRLMPSATIADPTGTRPLRTQSPIGAPSAFFLIAAPDQETAIRIAANAPHVGWGGSIVVYPAGLQ